MQPANAQSQPHPRRVVITGIGFTTAIGDGNESLWKNLSHSVSGARKITRFDASKFRTQIAATVEDFDATRYFERREIGIRHLATQYAVFAAFEAFADARLTACSYDPQRAGICWGTAYAGIDTAIQESIHFHRNGRVSPYFIPMAMHNASAYEVAKRVSLRGLNLSVATACSSSTNAIGLAFHAIRDRQIDLAFAGGSEAAVTPFILQAWSELRGAMSTQNDRPPCACKPFSKNRDGMLLGEGAGVLVLEELNHALLRDAPIYGEIAGYGVSCDTSHITTPSPDGQIAAMRAALEEAALDPEQIDYINAHGTGTRLNDKTETESIKAVFGERARSIPVNSSKPLVGHLMGASGAVELIISLLSMQRNTVHQTINYEVFDEECDLDYVSEGARPVQIDAFVSNSFAFGGNNAVLAAKRFHA